eukprot:GHVU01169715.1.p3 GENE.GHVU01169715.1~~GHVU01169715.1.p3  ORF type:complete len:132 (+),score=20.19 GHVU01169715.1:843-1238(+)
MVLSYRYRQHLSAAHPCGPPHNERARTRTQTQTHTLCVLLASVCVALPRLLEGMEGAGGQSTKIVASLAELFPLAKCAVKRDIVSVLSEYVASMGAAEAASLLDTFETFLGFDNMVDRNQDIPKVGRQGGR